MQDSGPLTGEQASQLLVERGVVEQEGRDEGGGEGYRSDRKQVHGFVALVASLAIMLGLVRRL